MATEGNVNANNLVQTNSPTSAFQGTVNSILTATNQEQSINIVNAEANQISRNGSLLVLATAPVVWQNAVWLNNLMMGGKREVEHHNGINENICKPIYKERGKSKSQLEITHTEKTFVS